MKEKEFISNIQEIVRAELYNLGLLTGQWQLGKVETVISTKRLKVFVNGSTISQEIPCNPDVPFAVGDEVFVQLINSDPKNKFVPYRRGI